MTTSTEFRLPVDDEIAGWLEAVGELADDLERDALAESISKHAGIDLRRTIYGLMRAIRTEVRAVEDQEQWLRDIAGEVRAGNARRQQTIDFLSEQVARIAESLIPEGKKSVDVPGLGRIQWRKVPEAVLVHDDEPVIAWLKASNREDLIRVKEEVRKADAKPVLLEHFKETGELIDGTAYQAEVELGAASIQWEAR